MAKYTAVAATTGEVLESWGGRSQFTESALSQLAETAVDKPVLLNFDETRKVGTVLSAKTDKGKLIVCIDLFDSAVLDKLAVPNKDDRLVPGFVVDTDEWESHRLPATRIIKSAKSSSYGLTRDPVEKNLPELKKTDE